LEIEAKKATTAKQINDAIQVMVTEYPFVGIHLSIITAMRVRALSLNAFQEIIGITPELNQLHVDFSVQAASAGLMFNSHKNKHIKDGSYSKLIGKELNDSYYKRVCDH
jgi:hypothetical protein